MHQRTLALASGTTALALTMALTACSGSSSGGSTSSGSAPADPLARLTAAKKVLDTTQGVHLKVVSSGVPKSAAGVLSADGDGSHAPAFKGTLTVQLAGLQIDVPVVATGGKTYAKLPTSASMQVVTPASYGAPDPAQLFSTDKGFSAVLPQTQHAKFGDKKRAGSDTVQVITGTLPAPAVQSVLPFAKATDNYTVSYEVTDKNELRTMALTGPFFPGATPTYTVTLTQYGEKVDVSAP